MLNLPKPHQTLLFSATMPVEVEALAADYLVKPARGSHSLHSRGVSDWSHGPLAVMLLSSLVFWLSPLAVITGCHHLVFWLSLPGVTRLVTLNILAVITGCIS